MSISFLRIIILAAVQGVAELLPVSSSAHVVVAEKLMGLDPAAPEMTLLLVALHSGTMFSVIVYFWNRWRATYFQDAVTFKRFAVLALLATSVTGVIGQGLISGLEKFVFPGQTGAEVEQLFSHLELISAALAVAGLLILIAGLTEKRRGSGDSRLGEVGLKQAGLIGAVQGLSLPFRGLSRSGVTISTGMLTGVSKLRSENFSFFLAVLLTPPVVVREALRLIKVDRINTGVVFGSAVMPRVLGAFCAFFAGLIALRSLSSWLEGGRWYVFGIYCLIASIAVASFHRAGY